MISRYARQKMSALWQPENRWRKWLQIEVAACEAMARLGQVPLRALKAIRQRAGFDPARIEEIEREVRHDVIAFLTAMGERIGPEARYLHLGLTSSDVLDTALAMLLRDSAEILEEDLRGLLRVLRRRAFEFRDTPMIGRTHGMHAEPITFGLKLALWYAEMDRNLERLGRAKERIAHGKISGAVGTFAHLSPEVEAYVCRQCGLKPAPISSQIIQRDRHAEYFTTLAVTAASLEKIALEIRHLQRTEVGEVDEPFEKGQKGSSAMPHKRNPIGAENITGLCRVVRANALAALENVPLWHERDISHSSVERIIAPDSTILLDFLLDRLTRLIDRLVVYPQAMRANLEKTGGLIFSEGVLLRLVQKGLSREQAYARVQRAAFQAGEQKKDFLSRLLDDPEVAEQLSPAELRECFDLGRTLRHVPDIFRRVFGREKEGKGSVGGGKAPRLRRPGGRAGSPPRGTASASGTSRRRSGPPSAARSSRRRS